MSKIRAYKVAEELGLEKEDFLKRAGEVGIELRSAMVALDDDQVEMLRRRLGGDGEKREEKRVGSSVIRRRRRVVKAETAPEPEPEVAAGPVEPVAAEPAVVGAEPEPAVAEAEPATEIQAEPAVAAAAEDAAATVAEESTDAGAVPAERGATDPPAGREPAVPPSARKQLTKRKVLEGVTLKEQDQLSRMMRGNVQQRLEQRRMIVDQQSRMDSGRRRGKPKKKVVPPAPGKRKRIVRLGETITFADLATQMGVKARDLLRKARTLDAEIDRDTILNAEMAGLLAAEFEFEVQNVAIDPEQTVAGEVSVELDGLEPRPPVVTVMGHVDHGKTSLLDTIRRANVVDGEAGGITQHIGAYQVKQGDRVVTFLDTPGHAAFTQMRARGAQVTDIAILVVAADDGIMPQSVEAINHARAAEVPIIVAVNKIDKPEANSQKVKQGLLEHDVVSEEFGGDVICVDVSAIKGTNINKLLEMVALQAEVLELKARVKGPARGTLIEARLDRGRGPVATVLVQQGTLNRGDTVVAGTAYGRVRDLVDDQGDPLKSAGPSTPVQIIGLSAVPNAGDELVVVKNEREAKQLVDYRLAEQRKQTGEAEPELAEDAFFAALGTGDKKELRVLIKADVDGTLEAIKDSITDLATEKISVNIVHSGVGGISESDVMLASASRAVIVGFHIRPEPAARKLAENEKIEIRTFDIVYELLDNVTQLLRGLLPPKITETVHGHAVVRELFVVPKVGTIAGCFISEGSIHSSYMVRVVRDGVSIYSGKLASLRRFKDSVKEVQSGLECGLRVENFNDVKVGDNFEAYTVVETTDTL